MPNMIRFWLPLLAFMFASPLFAQGARDAGFKSETILAIKNLQQLDKRLNNIGYKLITENTPFCKTTTARVGLLLHDVNQYGDQAAARFALGFNGPLSINAVAPDSAASVAGLLAGDDIAAINGMKIENIALNAPELAQELPAYRRIAAVNDMLTAGLAQGAVVLDILRGGEQQRVTVQPRSTCPGSFQIQVSDDRNASANGKMVTISSRLAEYFLNDDEFASVVAHELAHNLLKHKERLNAQDVNRGFFGQFGKSSKRIKETEIEADRLSVWLMANAGYDPQAAISFWTRYGKEHGKGIFSASTHYRWKKRVKLFEEELVKMGKVQSVDGKYPPPLLTAVNQYSSS